MFTHLHVHSEYSSLDGMCSIPNLANHCKNSNMQACAISDHGTLAGIHPCYQVFSKEGIKLLVGLEAYILEPNDTVSHLVLIAKNEEGYKNLLKLNLSGYRNRKSIFGRVQSRIKLGDIEQFGKGLIGLSACAMGNVAQLLRQEKESECIEYVRYIQRHLDHFFLEIQAHDAQDQLVINEKVLDLAKKLGDIAVVATTDAHYIGPDDYDIHDMLLAIQEKKQKDSPDRRLRFDTSHLYLKTYEEMVSFLGREDVVKNVQDVVDLCDDPSYLDLGLGSIPDLVSPDGNSESYLRYLCESALTQKKKDKDSVYRSRLERELEALHSLGMDRSMLVVYDYCKWARDNGILIGSRGSVGGCLAAYLLGITQVDPIRYDLIFERFANAERVSKGDIDVDFSHSRRDEVKQYLFSKYGEDKSVVIATVDRMKAKATIQDVSRSLGVEVEIRNKITKSFSDDVTLLEAKEAYPEFNTFMEEYPDIWKYSHALEGVVRQSGVHAGGVLISDRNLIDIIPLKIQNDRLKRTEIVATEYDMDTLDSLGLEKFDILSSANLTIIADTVELVKKRTEFKGFSLKGIEFTGDEGDISQKIEECSDDNLKRASKAYQLLRQGVTEGVFQLSGSGMRKFLGEVGVNSIDDIGVVLALHRPGPLESGNAYRYVRRRRGLEEVELIHSSLGPVLEKTYGVPVFQEDIMRIAQRVAGMSMGQADTFRKSIGKKLPELMESLRVDFMKGCKDTSGLTDEEANTLFESIESFAGYAFNGAHSIGYALTAFKTAYLKANYPAEFMTALLSNEASNSDSIPLFLREAEKMGIKITPSDVNIGSICYECISPEEIRRPLSAIHGIGPSVVEDIINKRSYCDFLDFIRKATLKGSKIKVNVIEILNKAGTLDCFGYTRAQIHEDIREITKQARKLSAKGRKLEEWQFSTSEEWDNVTKLRYERDVWGQTVSGSLFDTIKIKVKPEYNINLSSLSSYAVGTTGYVIATIKVQIASTRISKGKSKGKFMKVYEIEDKDRGTAAMVVWPNVGDSMFSQTETVDNVIAINSILLLFCSVTRRYKSEEKQLELKSIKKVLIEEIDW